MNDSKNEYYYFKQVESYCNADKHDLALQCANEGIESFPFCEVLYASRGEVYFLKKNFDKAIKDYETAIQLGLDTLPVWNNLGICYGVKNEFSRAIECFTKAIELGEENANTYLARAKAYRSSGKIELARLDEEKATKLPTEKLNKEQKRKCEIHELVLEEKEYLNEGFVNPSEIQPISQEEYEEADRLFPNAEIFIRYRRDEYSDYNTYLICPECSKLKNKWLSEKREQFYKRFEEEKRSLTLEKENTEIENIQKQISTNTDSKEGKNIADLKGVDCLEFQLKRKLKWKTIKEIPDFPFTDFADVRKSVNSREYTIGIDFDVSNNLARWLYGRMYSFTAATFLLTPVYFTVALIIGSIIWKDYWLLIGIPLTFIGFALGSVYRNRSKLVTLTLISILIYSLWSGFGTIALLVLVFLIPRWLNNFISYHNQDKLIEVALNSEITFIGLYQLGQLGIKENKSGKSYWNKEATRKNLLEKYGKTMSENVRKAFETAEQEEKSGK